MALQSSGAISLGDIAGEFGGSAPHSLSEYYNKGNAPASGEIQLAEDFYGTSNRAAVNLTIASNTQNYNVYTQASADAAYVAGTTDVTLTINSSVLVGSSSTGSYALTVPSNFTSGDTVSIVNNGVVIGRGGNGGSGNGGGGGGGGNAVYIAFATSITNNSTLAGGGGGGGGGGSTRGAYVNKQYQYHGGSGGGGGAGYTAGSGGSGGGGTSNGSSGSSGSSTSGGSGGTANADGGNGGGRGANGSSGTSSSTSGGGGGTRGYYLVGNSNVTWVANGTLQGRVS